MIAVMLGGCSTQINAENRTVPFDTITIERLGGPIGFSERFFMDNKDKIMCYESVEHGDLHSQNDTYIKKQSQWEADKKTKLSQLLKKCNILNWENESIDNSLYDGEVWKVKLQREDEVIEKYGVNRYPNEWDELLQGLAELFV